MLSGFFQYCQSKNEETKQTQTNPQVEKAKKAEIVLKKTFINLQKDTTIQIAGHAIDILVPSGAIKGNILVLPGWDFPKDDWCKKSSLCKKALAKGYRLVLPEMGRSIYSNQFYPETRKDWLKYPNMQWVLQKMFPELQDKYNLLTKEQNNFVLGLSTGGRGAALIALKAPELFKASASLSGDFDQSLMPTDRLMIGYYGTLAQFPERWNGEDNLLKEIKKFKVPIYLGHGKQDKVSPPSQTVLFYNALQKEHPNLKTKLNMVDAQHDYAYWDSEVENMLKFFEEIEK